MDRPQLVYVGGCAEQPVRCLYLGTDGDKAAQIFEAAAADGNNHIVRHCMFFEHVAIRTPAADGVPPRIRGNKPAAPVQQPQEQKPAEQQPAQ